MANERSGDLRTAEAVLGNMASRRSVRSYEDRKVPHEMVERLQDAREREIIVRRYGLHGGEAHTQKEVAAELGISRSYVSRIEKRALEKLKTCYEQQM